VSRASGRNARVQTRTKIVHAAAVREDRKSVKMDKERESVCVCVCVCVCVYVSVRERRDIPSSDDDAAIRADSISHPIVCNRWSPPPTNEMSEYECWKEARGISRVLGGWEEEELRGSWIPDLQ
jgi:hypothetical protein